MLDKNINIQIDQYNIFIGGLSEKGVDKKINQDAFCVGINEKYELAYIIVADGLGSCKYSDVGAGQIVEIIQKWFTEQLPQYTYISENVANIMIKKMVEEWNDSHDLKTICDYDTTIHFAVFYKGSLLIGGIGDGMMLMESDNTECKDYVDEEDLFSNITNSICSLNAYELIETDIMTVDNYEKYAVVIISTDGIADDLIPDKKITLPKYFRETIERNGISSLQEELRDWISDWETENHSDDKTLCYLVVEREGV